MPGNPKQPIPEPLHDPVAAPAQDPPSKPLHDPAGDPTYEPPRPVTERELTNLTAFAKLYGYVRFFHPSDQAANTDWEDFAIEGVRKVACDGRWHSVFAELLIMVCNWNRCA